MVRPIKGYIMNQIIIAGRLGNDPEVRYTSSGLKVTTFRLATNSRKGGKDETIWYRVTLWGDQFDKMMSYLKKGSAVIVTGELAKPEIYNDREGNPQASMNVTAFNITFSPFGKSQNNDGQGQYNSSENDFANVQVNGEADMSDNSFSDEEIPF